MDFINGMDLSRQNYACLTLVFLFFCGLCDENFSFQQLLPSHGKEEHCRYLLQIG